MSRRVIPAILSAAFLFGVLIWTSNIQLARAESGVVYVRADGSIDPSDAPILTLDNVTYTFIGDFNSTSDYTPAINIERDNITLDGTGHTLRGPGAGPVGTGVSLDGRHNVTVENFNIEAFGIGISMTGSSNNIIRGNRIVPSLALVFGTSGLMLFAGSSNNTITRNIIEHCTYKAAIYFNSVSNNTVTENTLTNNGRAIWFDGNDYNAFYHNDFVNNSENVFNHIPGLLNTWDKGYPSGGNYWGAGVDNMRGPYQNETGSDGIGDTPYSFGRGNDTDNYPLMKPYSGSHDIGVAVTLSRTSKTIIGEGYYTPVSTNVTIINYGVQAETFNFTFQMPTAVYQEEGLTLESRDSISLSFEWNTTGFSKGNYTISAYLTPVEGETFTSDNNQTQQITITIPGDVTSPIGPPDGKVDMRDIGAICNMFGTTPSDPNWNPNMEINNDGAVNMRDIGIACNNFGKT